jgi:hypothetical protein
MVVFTNCSKILFKEKDIECRLYTLKYSDGRLKNLTITASRIYNGDSEGWIYTSLSDKLESDMWTVWSDKKYSNMPPNNWHGFLY